MLAHVYFVFVSVHTYTTSHNHVESICELEWAVHNWFCLLAKYASLKEFNAEAMQQSSMVYIVCSTHKLSPAAYSVHLGKALVCLLNTQLFSLHMHSMKLTRKWRLLSASCQQHGLSTQLIAFVQYMWKLQVHRNSGWKTLLFVHKQQAHTGALNLGMELHRIDNNNIHEPYNRW